MGGKKAQRRYRNIVRECFQDPSHRAMMGARMHHAWRWGATEFLEDIAKRWDECTVGMSLSERQMLRELWIEDYEKVMRFYKANAMFNHFDEFDILDYLIMPEDDGAHYL